MESLPYKFDWHDFRAPCWYLVTLAASTRNRNVFAVNDDTGFKVLPIGRLAEIQWQLMCDKSRGSIVTDTFQLMPDHLHALIQVIRTLDRPLGSYIGCFKTAVTRLARLQTGYSGASALWEAGFDWRIKRKTEEIVESRIYLNDNPAENVRKRQLALLYGPPGPISHRRLPPRCDFGAQPGLELQWSAQGNRKLLEEELFPLEIPLAANHFSWDGLIAEALKRSRRGIVHISPAASPAEKKILSEVLSNGGKVIRILPDPFTPFYHPEREESIACLEGRFLAISHIPMEKGPYPLTHQMVDLLHHLSAEIAATPSQYEW